LCKTSVKMFPV